MCGYPRRTSMNIEGRRRIKDCAKVFDRLRLPVKSSLSLSPPPALAMLALAAAAAAAAPAPLPLLFSPVLDKEQRRWRVLALKQEGHSFASIARRTGLHPHTVAAVYKRYKATGSQLAAAVAVADRAQRQRRRTHTHRSLCPRRAVHLSSSNQAQAGPLRVTRHCQQTFE